MNGGKSKARVAVLYHGESEWLGDAEPFQSAGKVLMRSQIDYDVVPMDGLKDGQLDGETIHIGNAAYDCLLVASCEKMTGEYADVLLKLLKLGFCIRFVDCLPTIIDADVVFPQDLLIENESVVSFIREKGLVSVETDKYVPWLRYYQYENAGFTVHMFFNESPNAGIDTLLQKKFSLDYEYDAQQNLLYDAVYTNGEFTLKLEPGEARVFIQTEAQYSKSSASAIDLLRKNEQMAMDELTDWKILLADFRTPDLFEVMEGISKLEDIASLKPDFSGTICYETVLYQEEVSSCKILDLGEAYEAAEVIINGISAGTCISGPYIYQVSNLLKVGDNHLCIKVETTLGYSQKDMMSLMGMFEPLGMLGPVKIYSK